MLKTNFLVMLFILLSCSDKGRGGGTVESGIQPIEPIPTSITLSLVASGFVNPVQVLHAGDGTGRLFVVEKRGIVKIVNGSVVSPTPLLSIEDLVNSSGGEQGLLSIAFSPNFETNRTLYVHYTGNEGIGNSVIQKMSVLAATNTVDTTSVQTLLTVTQPFANHNGGQLQFGPDGMLYIGLGDGGGSGDPFNNAQNKNSFLGKILRIDVESVTSGYQLPTGNPFGNEVWVYGLRNPWRFSFDRSTGTLYIGDVGQDGFEEIDIRPASASTGTNYGWPIMEGNHCFQDQNCNQEGLTLPAFEYALENGNCALIGGFVYRGTEIAQLQGVYVYGDFCSGRIWGLRQTSSGVVNQLLIDTNFTISSFGEDERGNLYVVDFNGGNVYKILSSSLN